MKSLQNVFILVILPSITFAITSINDIQTYKPCMVDVTECPSDQVCFQYFCYPKNADANQPLQSCKRPSECEAFNDTKKCFKNSRVGICVSEADYELCESHKECEGRGGKCCGDYCCNKEYFHELLKMDCNPKDTACKEIKGSLQELEPPKVIVPNGSSTYQYGSSTITFLIISALMLN